MFSERFLFRKSVTFYYTLGLRKNILKQQNIVIWNKQMPHFPYVLYILDPEKVRYKVIGEEMKGMESSMKLVALGATQRRG